MNLAELQELFVSAGCKKLYAKPLAENDNSKNQIYFGSSLESLNLFPVDKIEPENSTSRPHLKAKLRFGWLLPNGMVADAPGAQLVVYPQYPEVRFSGFLKGSKSSPSDLMTKRDAGRVLFMGVTADDRIVGYVAASDDPLANEFRSLNLSPDQGVFVELILPNQPSETDSLNLLLTELKRINHLGWIASKQLGSDGRIMPCNAPQCGGFTLEAELGIPKNSKSEPDFHGWEIKQYDVAGNLNKLDAGRVTLFTPEPNGGFYSEQGAEAFVRKYGYPDKSGIPDRLNFSTIHKAYKQHASTNLILTIIGYDHSSKKIVDPAGSLALVDSAGDVAASWSFAGLLEHWNRKHNKAAYVPSICKKSPVREYQYGARVKLAQGTDFLLFLTSLASGQVYYDPAIKLENATSKPHMKQRNQFRVGTKDIGGLYRKLDVVNL